MTEAARPSLRRDRPRADTDQQIRKIARDLLVERGKDAVTLRAIARALGITAPALYRYYDSHEDLIQHVCADICADLANELADSLAAVPAADTTEQVFTVCRGFRAWALRHPREFALVFATPAVTAPLAPEGYDPAEPFGQVFLTIAGRVLATRQLAVPADEEVPEALVRDLTEFRRTVFRAITEAGLAVTEELFPLGTAYIMLRFWVRLYGQVALEVFNRFPFTVSDREALFESMLGELLGDIGLLDR